MWAKGLLEEGLYWCLGDGKQVHIWKDKWMPRPSTYKVQSMYVAARRCHSGCLN
jgi:hypothetical protein